MFTNESFISFISNEVEMELYQIHKDSLGKRLKAGKTTIEPWSVEDLRFLSLAMCGEIGELTELVLALAMAGGKVANIIKKHWRGDNVTAPNFNEKLKEEVADCAAYALLIAMLLDVDVDGILRKKLPEIRSKLG